MEVNTFGIMVKDRSQLCANATIGVAKAIPAAATASQFPDCQQNVCSDIIAVLGD